MTAATSRLLDEYLVTAARAGDRKAFAALVLRWQAKLAAHACRLTGDPDLARDAAQDGWVEIARGLPALSDAQAFPAWAYRIVTRRCAKSIGAARRRRALAAALEAEPPSPSAEIEIDDQMATERLRAGIRALPADQRAAVALFYFEELSVAEAAVALDVPAGTVKTRLMHARRKLRERMEGSATCVTSTR